MNRRGFLTNLIAGAAAIVGAGMVAPQAEASVPETVVLEATKRPLGWVQSHYAGWADELTTWSGSMGLYRSCEDASDVPETAVVKGYITAMQTDHPIWGEKYANALAEAKADAYNRGYDVASARAESRLAEWPQLAQLQRVEAMSQEHDRHIPGECASCDYWR